MSVNARLLSTERLAFAGLSPRTTIEAARQRYPHSSINGGHVYVSEADSHDHIYGIDLPRPGQPSSHIRVFFERRGRERNEYPRCEQVAGIISKQYGRPAAVQEFREERSWNRRLLWRRGEEELSLICFRLVRQPLRAVELTITSSR